ncbi:MAG: hypothetical protein UU67_C0003G0043 [Candidatus Daviesbacteria bacterium GW2011_GWB1_41_5]|uniref:Uncharacterized protein n=1 Tax=Candidatus Daviesbacteria bacterium GW2011_GWB1_41_5 TaxID=1618429 RepID=A0A0G0YXA3_9BACT|nr:MAG: hypothetical protein UU67_C0003G0043 [Candidatus Daviesbacteria bacterium GW2011_GWB1_41_5]
MEKEEEIIVINQYRIFWKKYKIMKLSFTNSTVLHRRKLQLWKIRQ